MFQVSFDSTSSDRMASLLQNTNADSRRFRRALWITFWRNLSCQLLGRLLVVALPFCGAVLIFPALILGLSDLSRLTWLTYTLAGLWCACSTMGSIALLLSDAALRSFASTMKAQFLKGIANKSIFSEVSSGEVSEVIASVQQVDLFLTQSPVKYISSLAVLLGCGVYIQFLFQPQWLGWVTLVILALGTFSGEKITLKEKKFREASELFSRQRVTLISSAFNGILAAKVFCLEDWWQDKVSDLCALQLNAAFRRLFVLALGQTVAKLGEICAFVFLFAVSLSLDSFVSVASGMVVIKFAVAEFLKLFEVLNNGKIGEFHLGCVLKCLSRAEHSVSVFVPSEAGLIAAENASFYISPRFSLRNISFVLQHGAWLSVVGSRGSGKSSLVKAFLEDTVLASGVIRLCGTSASVLHESWLMPGTIRSNILFGRPFKEELYQKVLNVTALDHDMACMLHGDTTEVVGQGGGFSGGQRHRIDLARALYTKSQNIFLDDPYADLDPKVASDVSVMVREMLASCNVVFCSKDERSVVATDSVCFLEFGGVRKFHTGRKDATANETDSEPFLPTNSGLFNVAVRSKAANNERLSINKPYLSAMGWLFPWGVAVMLISKAVEAYSFNWISSSVIGGVSLSVTLGVYAVLLVFGAVTCSLSGVWISAAINNALQFTHSKALRATMQTSLEWFFCTSRGALLAPFTSSVASFFFRGQMMYIATSTIAAIVGVIVGAAVGVPASLVAGPLYVVNVLLSNRLFSKLRQESIGAMLGSRDELRGAFLEFVGGAGTIRRYYAGDEALCTAKQTAKRYLERDLWYRWVASSQVCFSTIFSHLIVLGGSFYAISLRPSSGLFIAFLSQTSALIVNMFSIAETFRSVDVDVAVLLRRCSLSPEVWPGSDFPPPGWPSAGKVEFSSVTFSHMPYLPPALKNVSFVIPPNSSCGIVGRTGSGKSSLISLCLCLHNFDGSVFVDGVDIKTLDKKFVRSSFGFLPQKASLYPGSVRHIVDFTCSATPDMIIKCFKSLGLQDVDLDSEASAVYKGISEAQLILLAKLLLRNCRLLVLDEPTASFAGDEGKRIEDLILGLDATKLIVTHKIEFATSCDLICILNGGSIVGIGSPSKLIKSDVFLSFIESVGLPLAGGENHLPLRCAVCYSDFSFLRKEVSCNVCHSQVCRFCISGLSCWNCGDRQHRGKTLQRWKSSTCFSCRETGASRTCCMCEHDFCKACLVLFREFWDFVVPWCCRSCWPHVKVAMKTRVDASAAREYAAEIFQGDAFSWDFSCPILGSCTLCRGKAFCEMCVFCRAFICSNCCSYVHCPTETSKNLVTACKICSVGRAADLKFPLLGSPGCFFSITEDQSRAIQAKSHCVDCREVFSFFAPPYACAFCKSNRCKNCVSLDGSCNGCQTESSNAESKIVCDGCMKNCSENDVVYVNENRFHPACLVRYGRQKDGRSCAFCGNLVLGKDSVLFNDRIVHARCLVSFRKAAQENKN